MIISPFRRTLRGLPAPKYRRNHMRKTRTALILTALLLLTGCANSPQPDTEELSGQAAYSGTMAAQQLHTASIANARELGGLRMADGSTVRRGLLLRSAKLLPASHQDIAILQTQYHLGYIVDFRTPDEVSNAPDPVMDGVKQINLPIRFPVFSEAYNQAAFAAERLAILKQAYADGELGQQMYATALQNEETLCQYRAFFDVLLENQGRQAVLWHCSAGKDRTGLAAVLLLTALGAEEETVVQDFMLTNDFYAGAAESARERYLALYPDDPEIADGLAALSGGVREEYLLTALDFLKTEYGSAEAFLREKIGLSDAETANLRTYYLTQADDSPENRSMT